MAHRVPAVVPRPGLMRQRQTVAWPHENGVSGAVDTARRGAKLCCSTSMLSHRSRGHSEMGSRHHGMVEFGVQIPMAPLRLPADEKAHGRLSVGFHFSGEGFSDSGGVEQGGDAGEEFDAGFEGTGRWAARLAPRFTHTTRAGIICRRLASDWPLRLRPTWTHSVSPSARWRRRAIRCAGRWS